jgi:hypothetical protein
LANLAEHAENTSAAPSFGIGREGWVASGAAPDLAPGYPAQIAYGRVATLGAARRVEFCYVAPLPWGWPGEVAEGDIFERLRGAASRASDAQLTLGDERGHERALRGGDTVGRVALGLSPAQLCACAVTCTPGPAGPNAPTSALQREMGPCADVASATLRGTLSPPPAASLGLRALLACAAQPESTFGACVLLCGLAACGRIARRARPGRKGPG